MCGIAGIYSQVLDKEHIQEKLQAMSHLLSHRGPDGENFFLNDTLGLAHNRLSIVDLSKNGQQPFFSPDGYITAMFNGEIYNYSSLKETLQKKGYAFKGSCDGEILPYLYQEYGTGFLEKIEGMFAIVIYDQKKDMLFLARDRIGEKPLYYTTHEGTFYFSSEIKSFKAIDGFVFSLNEHAVTSYFLNTQIPAPLSAYNNIYKVMPSHYCLVDTRGDLSSHAYWHLDYQGKDGSQEYADGVKEEIYSAIKKTMNSDVPLGISLSGGLDSSLVLAVMAQNYDKKINSYTLGSGHQDFEDPEFTRALAISKEHNTLHSTVEIKNLQFSDLEDAMKSFDEPIGIYDSFHLLYLAEYIKGHNKVIMTGNGADEVFGGYNSYFQRKEEADLHDKEYATNLSIINRKDFFFNKLKQEYQNNYLQLQDILLDTKAQKDIENYSPDIFLDYYKDLATYDNFLDARLFNDLLISVNHSATLSDTPFMVHSIEARSPFLNHKLIEMVARLPNDQKINISENCKTTKYFLKNFAREYIPLSVIESQKYGCGQFIDYEALITEEASAETENLFFNDLKSELPDYFDREKIMVLWEKMRDKLASELERTLFRKLFIFLLWQKNCLAA